MTQDFRFSPATCPQALAREVAARVAVEGNAAGGAVRVARPAALGDVWKALEIAELLPAQLQARPALILTVSAPALPRAPAGSAL
jgi:hypothetical protein